MSEALAILYRNRIGAVALVDNEYHLRGCFSASDFRGVRTNFFDLFTGSVLSWLVKATHSDLKPPVTLPENATLADAVGLMINSKVHRVFIADPNGHPRAVVTMTDILSCLEEL
jgi:CBS domain-containing protein